MHTDRGWREAEDDPTGGFVASELDVGVQTWHGAHVTRHPEHHDIDDGHPAFFPQLADIAGFWTAAVASLGYEDDKRAWNSPTGAELIECVGSPRGQSGVTWHRSGQKYRRAPPLWRCLPCVHHNHVAHDGSFKPGCRHVRTSREARSSRSRGVSGPALHARSPRRWVTFVRVAEPAVHRRAASALLLCPCRCWTAPEPGRCRKRPGGRSRVPAAG